MMTELKPSNQRRIDQIKELWKIDAPFSSDPLDLPGEASNNYSHIAKYADIKTVEKRKLAKAALEQERMRSMLTRVVRKGALTPAQKAEYETEGWKLPPEGAVTLKADVEQYVNRHPRMIEMMLALAEQNDVIELLDTILKALHSRSHSINAVIKLVMFNHGHGG